MEKTKWYYSKKFKIILATFITILLTSLVLAISVVIYTSPLGTVYRVEYVKGFDDVFVQTYYKGEKISFPDTPKKDGYEFVGWSLDKNEDKFLTEEIIVDQELTFYAKWKEQEYQLKYNNEDIKLLYTCELIAEEDLLKIINLGLTSEIHAPQKEGERFAGWFISDGTSVYKVEDFSFDIAKSFSLTLIPLYEDVMIDFEIIANSNEYIIEELTHENNISIGEELSFRLILNNSVNNSNINITSTSGVVDVEHKNGVYNIKVNNFYENFKININNITINKYLIKYNNDTTCTTQVIEYGSNLILPKVEKAGYRLIGFKDIEGRYYSKEYIVTSNLELFAVWEEESYKINFPKNNGMYVICLGGEYLTSSKTINKSYNDAIEFEITLSSAYSNSQFVVYAITNNGEVYPIQDGNKYCFEHISSDMQIVVDNVILNTYSVTIDGISYGDFGYGSWIHVDGDKIVLKDVITSQTVLVNTMISDANFGGWVCNNSIVVNCIVQDIADDNGNVAIQGNYSKKVARIQLVANGGMLDLVEVVIVEGDSFNLPTPTKFGYEFAGWYTKLVEVNTIVDEELSDKFEEITDFCMILYAGWRK